MSRPSVQDQGDYELVTSKRNNHVIDTEDDTEVEEDVSEPYKSPIAYRSPYCRERLLTHFRKHAVFTALFAVFAGLMCLSILALVSFVPDCTFKKDDGNERYERPLYANIKPRPESIPYVNTSTVNGTMLLEKFYTEYYHNITAKTYRIALLGDSLVGGLYITYDIKTMLQLYLPMFTFEFVPFDVSGNRIADIRNRLDQVVEAKPDATFLFFDSDCYDIDEYLLSRSKVSEIRDAYRANLEYVLTTLINSNPNGLVALGGPTIGECIVPFHLFLFHYSFRSLPLSLPLYYLFPDDPFFTLFLSLQLTFCTRATFDSSIHPYIIVGEGPLFGPVPLWSYQQKKLQLDQYRSINNEIAASLGVPYVDVRGAFLKYLEGYEGK